MKWGVFVIDGSFRSRDNEGGFVLKKYVCIFGKTSFKIACVYEISGICYW